MAWNEAAFGKILHKDFSRFKYSRIPKITREYFITTKGLVIRGGEKGPGDLLSWDRIKEPSTSDGAQLLGIDFAGTVKFNTPITLTVVGRNGRTTVQEFPQMSTDFYYKLMSAWNVAHMFGDGPMRRKALIIWSKNKDKKSEKSQWEYMKEIYTCKIDELFRGKSDYRVAALEMYERGKLKSGDFEKTDYEIENMVKEYIKEKDKKERGMGFKSSKDSRAELMNRIDVRNTVNNSGARSTHNNYSRRWSDYTPHKRYGSTENGRDS